MKRKPVGFVIAHDRFLSGWGPAKSGRSLYALPVSSIKEAELVYRNARSRPEMDDVRIVPSVEAYGVRPGDHVTLASRKSAARWYRPGGFGPEEKHASERGIDAATKTKTNQEDDDE